MANFTRYACLALVLGSLPVGASRAQGTLALVTQTSPAEQGRFRTMPQQQPLSGVLKELETRYKVTFFYRGEVMSGKYLDPAHPAFKSLPAALRYLSEHNGLRFELLKDGLYVIVPQNAPIPATGPGETSTLPIPQSIPALSSSSVPTPTIPTTLAEVPVSGRVTQANGEGLPGVTVLVKGTSNGTATSVDGRYTLNVPENATLVFSSVGFVSLEKTVTGPTLDVVLATDTKSLDEVVVVGYGTQKRQDVTGSVTSVPQDRLERIPVANVAAAIQGAVAGVTVTSGSSVPGSQPSIRIRGVRSITANADPYIILDGVPLFPGNLNDITPTDIASIEILKDASATAIYGTRGSNGVILVTTKRGKTGKPQVRYAGYGGPEYMVNTLKPMSGEEYLAKYKAYTVQAKITPQPTPYSSELPNFNAGTTTDWIKEVSQQGYIQDHNVSVSGGTPDVKYYVSGDYFKQQGTVKGFQFQRVSFRSNIDANVTPWLRVGTSAFYANSNDDGGRASLSLALASSPYGQVYNPDGTYNIFPEFPERNFSSPLIDLTQKRVNRNNQLVGTGYLEVKPTFVDGLTYRLNGNYSNRPYYSANYRGRQDNNNNGAATITNDLRRNYTLENILTYNKDFGKHHFDLTALYSAQENTFITTTENGSGFINDATGYNNIGAGSIPSTISSYDERRALVSQMGRLNYSYDGRYLLTLTARRDGSTVFGAGTDKYATFPSAALAWNVTNEAFLKDNPVLSLLKLRLSYGLTGNEGINPYQTITGQSQLNYVSGGISTVGLRAGNLGNVNLKWESTRSGNVALDFGFLKNRISGTVEYYDATTKDLLLQRNLPTITGYVNILDNIGSVQNRGIEVTLNTVNVQHNDFTWETSFNISANRNRVLELLGNGADDIGSKRFIGKPLEAVYDYELAGVWQVGEDVAGTDPSAKPGDLKFVDQNGDHKIDATDRKYLGSTLPDYTAGLTNTFTYKGLSLRVFLQTAQGILKNNDLLNRGDYAWKINQPANIGYWTAENMSNDRPSLTYTNSRGYGYASDASYTRLKDVTLSYTIPTALLDRAKLGSLSVYVSGRNLYTWKKWIGYDPEQNYAQGFGAGNTEGAFGSVPNFPNVASYVFGINLGLR
ncbi:SusC/RagA family TonB-linked outer membrane protein [Hymenobacter terricola]|uniref:SusC/RagA family TonB-linked outer membrane protein n=1 Tax=Hymenobacter terricola TaxID=2819236 RepID=UPI001CF26BA6|nr:TonB-dependent receptor [Hymenobacter terricola]